MILSVIRFLTLFLLLAGCKKGREPLLFELLPANETGVHFVNKLAEDESLNILTYEYFYNGGGVGAGDINNDGRTDLLLGANMSESHLYLNTTEKGKNIQFKDITANSGITIPGGWARGIAMVDINADGFLDIYVSRSGPRAAGMLRNLLFINQKNNTFKEQGHGYGLDFTGNTTQTAFFDYDRDGDLDAYLVTNVMDYSGPNTIRKKGHDGTSPQADRLFRNNGNNTFTDISIVAGILDEGYGLGISIVDVNADGWQDVYVSNDYVSNDLLYINQQNGTFRNEINEYFRQQSYSAMGNDVADIDNDRLVDFLTVDMLPKSNERRKNMFGLMNYERHLSELKMGYEPQFMRNTLQHNNGNRPGTNHPFFSETGRYSGIQATDWSWSALFADYDNDGFRDLMITNGYPKDITNRDFVIYRMAEHEQEMRTGKASGAHWNEALKKIEGAHLPNFLFRNNHDLTFTDQSAVWGFNKKSFSNGAAYADLDNDGDLDLVINNLDQEAFIYKNHSELLPDRHFLRLRLEGPVSNRKGLGVKVSLFYKSGQQFAEHSPYRGYQSSVEEALHFGLGKVNRVDSIRVTWPDQKAQLLVAVQTDQLLTLKHADAIQLQGEQQIQKPLFARNGSGEPAFVHRDEPYIDFKIQPLLPHLQSQNGPGLAVGDVNGDGLDDFFMGGGFNQPGNFFIQTQDKEFTRKPLTKAQKFEEDMGSLLFDADSDGDNDLYVVSGSSEFEAGSPYYQDRFYRNDGNGKFSADPGALPAMTASGSTVNAVDFDRDGDLDLFVGGRLSPGQYPLPGRSFVLRNDRGKFTDVTKTVCAELTNIGMVTTALWTDFDQDGWMDLLIAGEWMPLTFFKNKRGRLVNVTAGTGLPKTNGWWNSMSSADFDEDGDTDYVVGNVGLNSEDKPSKKEPLTLIFKDFDKNGTIDPVLCRYVDAVLYPVHPRDEMTSQMNFLKKRFVYYADYSKARISDVFRKEELEGAERRTCEIMQSVLLRNLGDGKFSMEYLPAAAQLGPVYGIIAGDYDYDGHADIMLTGNSYATESISGRMDALSGLLLTGNGKGSFLPVKAAESGILVEGDGKGLAELRLSDGSTMILAAQNNAALKVFTRPRSDSSVLIRALPGDIALVASYSNGKKRRYEMYFGSGYLSQSSRNLAVQAKGITGLIMMDAQGKSRNIPVKVIPRQRSALK